MYMYMYMCVYTHICIYICVCVCVCRSWETSGNTHTCICILIITILGQPELPKPLSDQFAVRACSCALCILTVYAFPTHCSCRVCVSVSGVLFSVGVCVCDLLVYLPTQAHIAAGEASHASTGVIDTVGGHHEAPNTAHRRNTAGGEYPHGTAGGRAMHDTAGGGQETPDTARWRNASTPRSMRASHAQLVSCL